MDYSKYIEYLVKWIQQKVKKSGLKGVVLGLSGGIDSAVVAALSKLAFPDNSLGLLLPIDSMKHDLQDIERLIDNIHIDSKTIDLKSTFDQICQSLDIKDKTSISNIKPRLRMTSLYAVAQENQYLVLGTDNKIEWEVGYFTKYGDGGADLLPISCLLKSQVMIIAKILNVPESIILKDPSAGLWDGQTDEKELGFSYKEADDYFSNKPVSKETTNKIQLLQKNTNHKRVSIPRPLPLETFDK